MSGSLTIVTDFGDSGLLSALALIGAGYLTYQKCYKGAGALAASLLTTALLMALLKILFIRCGVNLFGWDIRSPSGHTALSLAVYGTLALLAGRQLAPHYRAILYAVLSLLVASIALTRVLLHVHNTGEVLCGLIAGGIALTLIYIFLSRGRPTPPFASRPLIALSIAAALLLHGTRLPAETWIHLIAQHVPVCARTLP